MYNNILSEIKISYIGSIDLEAKKLYIILEHCCLHQEKRYLVAWKHSSWSVPESYAFELLLNWYS